MATSNNTSVKAHAALANSRLGTCRLLLACALDGRADPTPKLLRSLLAEVEAAQAHVLAIASPDQSALKLAPGPCIVYDDRKVMAERARLAAKGVRNV